MPGYQSCPGIHFAESICTTLKQDWSLRKSCVFSVQVITAMLPFAVTSCVHYPQPDNMSVVEHLQEARRVRQEAAEARSYYVL